MGKKNLAIYTPGRLRRRKNFPAAEGGRQIFWVDPWEVDPWVTKFSLPLYGFYTKRDAIFVLIWEKSENSWKHMKMASKVGFLGWKVNLTEKNVILTGFPCERGLKFARN